MSIWYSNLYKELAWKNRQKLLKIVQPTMKDFRDLSVIQQARKELN